MELSEIQRWKVIPALKQVPGVADVDNFGGFTKEYQLELDPAQLQRYGLGSERCRHRDQQQQRQRRRRHASRAASRAM